MKAMILAAGLGTRLLPLTRDIPKALIPLNGVPLLELQITRLKRFGFNELVINIHHHGQQIIDFLESHRFFGLTIRISDERDLLLDTGGAIRKAKPYIEDDQPVLVHNVDVITSLNPADFMRAHLQSEARVSLCVQKRDASRYFYFGEDDQLCGWKNTVTGEEKWVRPPALSDRALAFSGIHIIGPRFFSKAETLHCFPGHTDVFSVVDVYLCMAGSERIMDYDHSGDLWMDLGRPEDLKAAENLHVKTGGIF